MNERYDIPETSVNIRRICAKNCEECDMQDVVAGIEVRENGVLQIDLRNMRPMRVLDRDGVIIELYLRDVLNAVAMQAEKNDANS